LKSSDSSAVGAFPAALQVRPAARSSPRSLQCAALRCSALQCAAP
jgi:hypothetical protein